VLRCVATSGEGVADVLAAIDAHRRSSSSDGTLVRRRAARVRDELRAAVAAAIEARAAEACAGPLSAAVEADLVAGRIDLASAAERLLDATHG
jgi:LAO/AO transport system kinase